MGNGELAKAFVAATGQPEPASSRPQKPTIQKLNFNHEAIIRWMLENPTASHGDCAAFFGYTPGWFSIIIHSDAFKAKWAELSNQADALVINDIPAKMRGVASRALEGLADQVDAAVADQTAAPRDFLLKSSEMLLKSLGYGGAKPQQGGVTINAQPGAQVNVVPQEALARAKTRLLEHRANNATVVPSEPDATTKP